MNVFSRNYLGSNAEKLFSNCHYHSPSGGRETLEKMHVATTLRRNLIGIAAADACATHATLRRAACSSHALETAPSSRREYLITPGGSSQTVNAEICFYGKP